MTLIPKQTNLWLMTALAPLATTFQKLLRSALVVRMVTNLRRNLVRHDASFSFLITDFILKLQLRKLGVPQYIPFFNQTLPSRGMMAASPISLPALPRTAGARQRAFDAFKIKETSPLQRTLGSMQFAALARKLSTLL
jgi:hypothetical protein